VFLIQKFCCFQRRAPAQCIVIRPSRAIAHARRAQMDDRISRPVVPSLSPLAATVQWILSDHISSARLQLPTTRAPTRKHGKRAPRSPPSVRTRRAPPRSISQLPIDPHAWPWRLTSAAAACVHAPTPTSSSAGDDERTGGQFPPLFPRQGRASTGGPGLKPPRARRRRWHQPTRSPADRRAVVVFAVAAAAPAGSKGERPAAAAR
jgi:hypothetical protein